MRRVYKVENLQSKVDGILVRPVHPDDAADLYAIISQPQVTRTLVYLPSMEFTDTVNWLKQKDQHEHRLVAEIDGRAVGSATMSAVQNPRRKHTGEIGLMVHHSYWRRGVGTALMAGLINMADNWLDLKRLELSVFADNKTAIHLYEKFGFEKECVMRDNVFGDGRFQDELFMARLRGFEGVETSETPLEATTTAEVDQAELKKLKIRALHPDDVDDLYRLWGYPQVGRTTMQLPSQEWWRSKERVENRPSGFHRLVADLDSQVVGMIGLGVSQNPRMAHTAHLGMMVSPAYWGLGIGSRLMAAMLDLADNWLNLRRVELEVNVDNPAAIHLYEKFGFEIEGRKRFHTYGDGRWADSYLMSRMNRKVD
ncbi:MAG: GNAT family N-acetyltransferase [Candidatus Promineifilaceae bacterium]